MISEQDSGRGGKVVSAWAWWEKKVRKNIRNLENLSASNQVCTLTGSEARKTKAFVHPPPVI